MNDDKKNENEDDIEKDRDIEDSVNSEDDSDDRLDDDPDSVEEGDEEGKKKEAPKPSLKERISLLINKTKSSATDLYDFVITNFRPTIWTSAFTVVGLVLLIGLGYWQLGRMEWKERLLLKIEERQAKPAVELPPSSMMNNPEDLAYRDVYTAGEMMFLKTMKLLPRTYKGENGYHVLTPLRLPQGDIILVNRGWVPEGKKPSNTYWDTQNIKVAGTLTTPEGPGLFTPDNAGNTDEWYYIDLEEMAKHIGVIKLYPLVLEQEGTGLEDKYPIGGQTRIDMPNNHFKYSLFWFVMAFGLFVIWIIYSFQSGIKKNTAPNKEDDPDKEDDDEDTEEDLDDEDVRKTPESDDDEDDFLAIREKDDEKKDSSSANDNDGQEEDPPKK